MGVWSGRRALQHGVERAEEELKRCNGVFICGHGEKFEAGLTVMPVTRIPPPLSLPVAPFYIIRSHTIQICIHPWPQRAV